MFKKKYSKEKHRAKLQRNISELLAEIAEKRGNGENEQVKENVPVDIIEID